MLLLAVRPLSFEAMAAASGVWEHASLASETEPKASMMPSICFQ